MTNYLRFFTLVIAVSLIGCGATLPKVKPYKMDIQQGNVVTSEMLLKLRPGMTKSQVKFIMGTPLLVDSFRTNRWDYFYQLRKQGKIVNQRRVILDFEEDLLKRVRGDVVPKGKTAEDVVKQVEAEAEAEKAEVVDGEGLESSGPVVSAVEDAPDIEAVDQTLTADAEDEPVSVLAKPIAIEPVEDVAPVQSLAEEMESSAADVAKEQLVPDEAPAAEVIKAAPVAPAPKAAVLEEVAKPEAPTKETFTVMPTKTDTKKKVFRLDRTLDMTRIVPSEVSTSTAPLQESVVKEVKESLDQDLEESPGFFERALEKIGF